MPRIYQYMLSECCQFSPHILNGECAAINHLPMLLLHVRLGVTLPELNHSHLPTICLDPPTCLGHTASSGLLLHSTSEE